MKKRNKIIIIILVLSTLSLFALVLFLRRKVFLVEEELDPNVCTSNNASTQLTESLQGFVDIDWDDFIKINGMSYIGDWRKTEVSADQIGEKIGEVLYGVPTVYIGANENLINSIPKDGAAFLCKIGTELFTVKDSHESIAALVDGNYYLYVKDIVSKETVSMEEHNKNITESEEIMIEPVTENPSTQPTEPLVEQPETKPTPLPQIVVNTDSAESQKRIPYELGNITENYYEKNGYAIEFKDLPENDAETIACLYWIEGPWLESKYDYYYVPKETSEGNEELGNAEGNGIFEWVIVENVETISIETLAECDPKQVLFATLMRRLKISGTYEDYVQMLLDNDCVAVCVRYVNKYTKEVEDGLPQISDGENEQHWLFVPDENGQLRVFDYTHIFAAFSFHPDAEAPNVLKQKVK